ncbi:uncharacterized protein LOC131637871 [Vicia villosa]|uniref:uncharacterized protein LOC131637871 n=1 Tax=Vicia villosa TaxID=3911 RepID=UPI00273ABEF5|nr:uncharacterized protein LOC131637871 [Vicia villosa]
MIVKELELIEKFRDMSLVCEVTPKSVRLGMMKINNDFLDSIREAQKLDVKLVDSMVGIDQFEDIDFKLDAQGVLKFRNQICIPDDVDLKRAILEEVHRMSMLADIYTNVIVKLHGVPLCIVSDRDSRFTFDFWKSLQGALGSKLRLSSAYHPQTDGQTERTI